MDGNGAVGGASRETSSGELLQVQRLQQDVQETVGLMKSNVEKVIARGERLEELDVQTGKKSNIYHVISKENSKLKTNFYRQSGRIIITDQGECF